MWFRKPSLQVPQRDFVPSDLSSPFRFRVVTIDDDGSVAAYRTPASLISIPERFAAADRCPALRIVDGDFHTWRPVELIAVADSRFELFGQRLLFVEFRYEAQPASDLETVRRALRAAIDNDPDDIWNQATTHEDLLRQVADAASFAELVDVILAPTDGDRA